MSKQFLKDALGWGIGLWIWGYALGMMFFSIVPPEMIGWFVMPLGVAATLWVLLKKVKGTSFRYFLLLGVIWALIAIVFDYVFLIKAFKLEATYYKPDVYLYYALMFLLPVIVGWKKFVKK